MKIDKQTYYKIILVVSSIIFILILIEVALRLFGHSPRKVLDITINEPITYKYDHNLGWSSIEGKHKFKPWSDEGQETFLNINSDGSRYTGQSLKKNNKLIFIGGSVTQGWAVNDHETFPYMIQNKNSNYGVYNFGTGGYGGYQSLLLLEKVLKEKKNIKFVVYGFINHHEERNIASGKWMYILNYYSKRGQVDVPYASINNMGELIRYNPIKYAKLPLSKYSSLSAKLEQKIMYLKSYFREKKQTEVSLKIINEMNELSLKKNIKFILLFLEKFNDDRDKKYRDFLNDSEISFIECSLPGGEEYIVKGEGHPNFKSHKKISECFLKEFNLVKTKNN